MLSHLKGLVQPLGVLLALTTGLLVHEVGHVIAAYITGGTVTEVVIFSATPHVLIAGNGSDSVEAFRAAAGSGLVIFISLALALIGTGRRSVFAETLETFCIVELIGWTGSLLVLDNSPNDATDFLRYSTLPRPLLITVCSLIALLFVWIRARSLRPLTWVVQIGTPPVS